MSNIGDFFEYQTFKFWIALFITVLIQFIPILPGEEDIVMILFKALWAETHSFYFLLGILAVEFVILIVPFVGIQRFLSEKLDFD